MKFVSFLIMFIFINFVNVCVYHVFLSHLYKKGKKAKFKLESQNPLGKECAPLLGNNRTGVYLGTVVPVSLKNNGASLTWQPSCPLTLGNNCTSVT